ncbi:MAG TPA: alpha-ketoglutarate-dependent dioxygenase AlkB [Patescibacteria group bacterium]|nr:alpha-ketoglutarate-dependent dioxygenase AlkB [Patescibacteria group bacterium]
MQPDLFGTPAPLLPPGFLFRTEAISPEEESEIIRQLAPLPFKEFEFRGYEGKRRVVSFGWKYDFSAQKLLKADPIPEFLVRLCEDVVARCGFPFSGMSQVLVTEYTAGAAIGWHKDRPVFEQVVGLSLASPCTFRLRRPEGAKWTRVNFLAPPRSSYFMEGPARWDWEHSIPPVEDLRYSITFRNMRRAPDKSG